MLQGLSERVRLCYERAAEAREHAEAMNDSEAKADFQAMERRWLLLARSYQFTDNLENFIGSVPPAKLASPFDPYTLFHASGAAVFAKDTDSRMIVVNPACLSIIGRSWSELRGRNDVQWHSDRVQARAIVSNDKQVVESQQTHIYEEPFDTPAGSRIILSTKAPLRDDKGQIVGIVGIAKDITESKKREERAEFLHTELRHRLKNLLSIIQAMARLSLKPSDGFSQFETRLLEYARSQDLLYDNSKITLHQLIAAQCAAIAAGNKLHVSGPDVFLSPECAIQIGIALNELVTNSIKYGALGANGSVSVQWYVESREGRKQLFLHWNELHQRLQDNPPQHGYGHRVLTSIVPARVNGIASLEIMPGEVRWRLCATVD